MFSFCAPNRRGILALGALLSAASLLGCQGYDDLASVESSRPEVSRTSETPDPLLVSKSAFKNAFLIVQDGRVRWRFQGDRFVVESWRQPLPIELRRQFLVNADDRAYRVAGRWQLRPDGRSMSIDSLSSDHIETLDATELRLDDSELGLRIAGIDYQLADHPGTPEFYPKEIHWGRCVEVLAGDKLAVAYEEGDQAEIQLAGIICPPPNTDEGSQAISACRELIGEQRLLIKLFEQPDRAGLRAQVITDDLVWINYELVRDGHAWHDKTTDREWQFALKEDEARDNQRGLWERNELAPPWFTNDR